MCNSLSPVLNNTLRIIFTLTLILFSFPSRSNVDISISAPSLSWIGPYHYSDAKPFPCPSRVEDTAAVYCLASKTYYILASVDYISPDDPIMSLADKSCTIEMSVRIKNENISGKKALVTRRGGWSKAKPVDGGYIFLELTKNSNDCISDLQSISDWGAAYFRLQGYSRSTGGEICADLYVSGDNYHSYDLIEDSNPWTCGQGSEVSLPEDKPVCDIYIPDEINFGTVGVSSNHIASETVDIDCNQNASISFYFTPAGTPVSAAPGGKVRLTLGPSVTADLCLQSSSTSKCEGGNAPLKWNDTNGEILITTQLSVGKKAEADDYVGETILVANIN